MRKVFCDCCDKEIAETQTIYTIDIRYYTNVSDRFNDVCPDCYKRVIEVLRHKKHRKDI